MRKTMFVTVGTSLFHSATWEIGDLPAEIAGAAAPAEVFPAPGLVSTAPSRLREGLLPRPWLDDSILLLAIPLALGMLLERAWEEQPLPEPL